MEEKNRHILEGSASQKNSAASSVFGKSIPREWWFMHQLNFADFLEITISFASGLHMYS